MRDRWYDVPRRGANYASPCRLDRLRVTNMARLGTPYCGALRKQNSCQWEACLSVNSYYDTNTRMRKAEILKFLSIRLESPIHAPKIWVFGEFYPQNLSRSCLRLPLGDHAETWTKRWRCFYYMTSIINDRVSRHSAASSWLCKQQPEGTGLMFGGGVDDRKNDRTAFYVGRKPTAMGSY